MNNLAVAKVIDFIELPEDAKHNFAPVSFKGVTWDLSHLDSFVFRLDHADLGLTIDVVVIFSCHCFTHSLPKDPRPRNQIPHDEIYKDEKEERVLDAARYQLSKQLLRTLVTGLPERRIIVANDKRSNFMTWDVHNPEGVKSIYGVFFDTERDKQRKRRILLRIQSAYILDNGLKERQRQQKGLHG